MTHPEASRLNLEYYRKQAKSLLKDAQAGDPSARGRMARHSAETQADAWKLHRAQLAVAREQGFPSWPRFRTFVLQSGISDRELVARFIAAALSDLRRAEAMLESHPSLEGGGFYVDLVLGNARKVERALAADPGLVHTKGGPRNAEPLIYTCFSRFASRTSPRAPLLAQTARVLLRQGADHAATTIHEDYPEWPLSCLYGAVGLNNNVEMATALLDAGANPNDNESLYHSTEHPDLEGTRLLLSRGAKPRGTNAVKHILDWESPQGLRLLLDAGADPNDPNTGGETGLHWAVWRGRSPAIVEMLLDAGADPNACRADGATAYALALRAGDTAVVQLLEKRGAAAGATEADRLLYTCATAGPDDLAKLAAARPAARLPAGMSRILVDLAMNHRTDAVRALLAAGVPVDSRGPHGGTALHWACWKGYADIVELLLQHGASLSIQDTAYQGVPAGWFGHGVRNNGEGGSDYPGVARLLLAAGARIPPPDIPTGRADVDEVLRAHGLI